MGKKNKIKKQQTKLNKWTNKNTKVNNMKKPYEPKPQCHTGMPVVFTTHDGITVHGGGRNRQGGWWTMTPLPDLSIGASETMTAWGKSKTAIADETTVPDGWSCADAIVQPPKDPLFIHLDFPDFGIPASGAEFWYALTRDIRVHGIKTISTQCAGGHGRTGVQLSILRYLLCDDKRGDYNSASDIVRWVRDVYCHHAVETQAQLQYIADVCQLPVGDMTIGSRWGGDTNFPKAITGIDEKHTIYDNHTIYDEYLEWEEEYYDDGMDILFEDFGTCPCCKSPMANKTHCSACDYFELPSGKTYCDTCGDEKDYRDDMVPETINIIDGIYQSGTCVQCVASQNKIKFDYTSVQCSECKQMKDNIEICMYDKTEKEFICGECAYGDKNIKEEEQ